MIASSLGEGVGLTAGAGASVCACVDDSAKIDKAINSQITFLMNVILSEAKDPATSSNLLVK
jgi:hypothetical protein